MQSSCSHFELEIRLIQLEVLQIQKLPYSNFQPLKDEVTAIAAATNVRQRLSQRLVDWFYTVEVASAHAILGTVTEGFCIKPWRVIFHSGTCKMTTKHRRVHVKIRFYQIFPVFHTECGGSWMISLDQRLTVLQ